MCPIDPPPSVPAAGGSLIQKLSVRAAVVGDNITIRRALPHRNKKTIGAWCFLDHFGPIDLQYTQGLRVGPHPHIGLQTFTYSLIGEMLHRDSLGSHQIIQANQINVMTAGKGIAHAEESLSNGMLHGVQLWIALPDAVRKMEPDFIHYAQIPALQINDLSIRVLVGEWNQMLSPVKVYSPLIGLDIHAVADTEYLLPLQPEFEYGILPLVGQADVVRVPVDLDTLLYVPCGQSTVSLQLKKNARVLIIGGEPFQENILIWWNFVARTQQEMIEAATAWEQHTAFGDVAGAQGPPLHPPSYPA